MAAQIAAVASIRLMAQSSLAAFRPAGTTAAL
jgi:hypothetical protein